MQIRLSEPASMHSSRPTTASSRQVPAGTRHPTCNLQHTEHLLTISCGVQGQVSYLSSARLMSLQMGDPALRRTFLVQCLILLHACQHPDKKEKDALRGKQVSPCSASLGGKAFLPV